MDITTPVTNDCVALVDGPQILDALERALWDAREYIYITAWMIHPTLKLGQYSLFQLLQKKVGEGVDVRILLSDVNPTMRSSASDRSKLHIIEHWEHRRVKRLNDHGIQTHLSTLPVRGLIARWIVTKVSRLLGYSIRLAAHHQKSVVVDGKVGFCLGSDLVHLICYPARWHEAAVMVRGRGVLGLEQNFVYRWNCEAVSAGFAPISRSLASVIASKTIMTLKTIPRFLCPTTEIREAYCAAIREAKRTIYIQNQYFRDPKIAEVLIASIRRGVSVCIILPNLPEEIRLEDGHIMSLANSISMFAQYRLLKSLIEQDTTGLHDGISTVIRLKEERPKNLEILYPPEDRDLYIHSKLMIVDEFITLIGSANINGRSMSGKCDTEMNLCIKSREFAIQIKDKLSQSLEKSGLIAYDVTALARDERMSRINEAQLRQVINVIRQQSTLLCETVVPNWLPRSMRTRLVTIGEKAMCQFVIAFLNATDASSFRTRLTNLALDFI